jgi:hypothetical protein
VFDQQFRFAIGVGGEKFGILLNWRGFRLTVDCGGGREDQAAGTASEHCFEERECCSGVVPKECLRSFHGFAGFDEGGEVEDAVEGRAGISGCVEKVFNRGPICDFTFHELYVARNELAPAVTQVVENDSLMPLSGEEICDCPANVSSATSD